MNEPQLELPGFVDECDHSYETEARQRVHQLDKGELHLHLNGALPVATVLEMIECEQAEIPRGFDVRRDLIRHEPCRSLAEYLAPWRILRLVPRCPENLSRLADAAMGALAEHRVRFAELRSSVLYIAGLQQCSPAVALKRLILSTGTAADRHGIRRGLILTVTRGDYSVVNLTALLQAYTDLGRPRDVVGIDLAGDEDIPVPAELPDLFRHAKDRYGLGVTIHAGETGRIENIRVAIEKFGADRVGHGTAAGRDPRLMALLAERDICVEVCPISNRLTGAVPPDEAHPLREFIRSGVPFVICADNPGIHQRGLTDDMVAAMAEGVSETDLRGQYTVAKRYSFIRNLK